MTRTLAARAWLGGASVVALLAAAAPAFTQSVAVSGDVTPSPATSPLWVVGGDLQIGATGAGALTVSGRGTVLNGSAGLGLNAGAAGSAIITGRGSTWNNNGNLDIGLLGSGSLLVEAGGVVSNADSVIGLEAGSVGRAVVTGAGSVWTSAGLLAVGRSGNATLAVEAGAQVFNGNALIGGLDGSTGAAVVSGPGSAWISSGLLGIGSQGSGSLVIEAGGRVQSQAVGLGILAGSTGRVSVVGTGSVLNTTGFVIGAQGAGSLAIGSGGQALGSFGIVGQVPGTSPGTVTITGTGSAWRLSNALAVGALGTGLVSVTSGGELDSPDASVGTLAGSTGEVTVTGAGSIWRVSNGLVVGTMGTGRMAVTDGGEVVSTNVVLSAAAGSVGEVKMMGAGSTWGIANALLVGVEGAGRVELSAGANLATNIANLGLLTGSVGEARVTGAGSTLTVADILSLGLDGAGTLTLAEGGRVAVGGAAMGVAASSGSTGTVNIGAAADRAPVAAGTLSANALVFGDGDGRLVFNHTGNPDGSALVFAPSIVGNGRIDHRAGTTVLAGTHSAAAPFTGTADVSGGRLVVNTTFGDFDPAGGLNEAQANVRDTGTLAGAGTLVGSLSVAPGGTLAPGNSVGTLTVAGDASFAPGSTFAVETQDGASDRLVVGGTARLLGGTVRQTSLGGLAQPSETYTILTAAGGISGRFDAVAPDGATLFVSPQLIYTPTSVLLRLGRNDVPFAAFAQTPNGRAAAGALDVLGPGNGAARAVAGLIDAPAAAAAFDLLSGEIHASVQTGLIENGRHVREAVTRRLDAAFGPEPVEGEGDGIAFAGPVAWATGYGAWGRTDGDGNAAALDRDTGGFLIGADALLSDTLRLGLFAGWGRSDLDLGARASVAEIETTHLGLYAGTTLSGVSLKAGAAYAWHDVDTRRAIAFTGFADALAADIDAHTAQVFGEAGYRIALTPAAHVEPFAGLAHVRVDTDAFRENGGAAALASGGFDTDATVSTLGLRAGTVLDLGPVPLTLTGSAAWRHALDGAVPAAGLAFAAGGPGFAVEGAPVAEDVAALEFGLAADVAPNAGLSVNYSGQFGSGIEDNGLMGRFEVRF